jgi:formylglycine-generating enzyme required for sulfatase activity
VAGKDFPVTVVTWQDAEEFCRQASKKTRRSIHLPTEAQWENACRAGADTRFFFGDDESKLGEYVWYRENMGGRMHAVGLKKPNAWGLYDINGLMWEYCLAGEGEAKAAQTDAAKAHVMRGATWGSRPPMFVLGVSLPAIEDPKAGLDRCGMRAAMDAD